MAETKKARDFTASAEKLCNPPEVKEFLDVLHRRQAELDALKAKIPAELSKEISQAENYISAITAEIKTAVEAFGSYQDTETGDYAVRYRRVSKVLHPEPLKKHFPKFAPLLIVEAVNAKALEGQIKGGLLSLEDLKEHGVFTETQTYAFYVR